MKNKILDIRYILFFLVLLLLITPFLQNNLNIFEIEPLKGDIDEVQEVNFSFNEWFDANYQNQQETYLNESFGFRNSLVRLHNQLRFSLFKNANARGIVVGIDNYLYELPYINAYYGIDFIGEDSIKKRMQQLKYVQDTLEKLDKNIILIFAAGKASFYPEYIPEKYRVEKKINNYEVYTKYAHELGIAHIDFNKWFIENKNISPYPLFPQYGIHWSNYSMFYVADSIISYIEDLRNINMRHLYWDEIKFDQAKKGDYDIAEGMNLLYYLPSYEMAYPKVFVEIDTGQVKPRIVSVADSFYWGIYNLESSEIYSNNHFWYYNKLIYPESFYNNTETDDIDFQEEINNHDIFLIMATEASLPHLSWDFIEQAYDFFTTDIGEKKQKKQKDKKMEKMRQNILSNEKWLKDIEQKAEMRNISVDSMITIDILWLLEQE